MQEQVLYYSGVLDQKTSEAILAALEACQIAYTVLEDSDLDQSIQSLLNTKKQAVIVNRRHQEACMLFREGKEQTFVKLRRAFAQRQIIYSGSKAVVTKHNRTWSFIKLLEEVEEEHRYFQLYEAILKQLKESEVLREEAYEPHTYHKLQLARLHVFQTLQKQSDYSALLSVQAELQQALAQLCKK